MFLFLIVIVCLLAPFFCRLRSFVIFLFQQEVCRAILPTCGSSSSIRLRLCEETCTAPIWCNYCISTCRGKTVSPMDGKLCRSITLGDPKPHTRLDIWNCCTIQVLAIKNLQQIAQGVDGSVGRKTASSNERLLPHNPFLTAKSEFFDSNWFFKPIYAFFIHQNIHRDDHCLLFLDPNNHLTSLHRKVHSVFYNFNRRPYRTASKT